MANSQLWISEFAGLARAGNSDAAQGIPAEAGWIQDQIVWVGAAATSSQPFNQNTKILRLVSDVSCAVAFGFAPIIATNASSSGICASGQMFIPANTPIFVGVETSKAQGSTSSNRQGNGVIGSGTFSTLSLSVITAS
jgi:hypothetical protein